MGAIEYRAKVIAILDFVKGIFLIFSPVVVCIIDGLVLKLEKKISAVNHKNYFKLYILKSGKIVSL